MHVVVPIRRSARLRMRMQPPAARYEIMEGLNEQSTAPPIRPRVPNLSSRGRRAFPDLLGHRVEAKSRRKTAEIHKTTEIKVVDFRSGEAVIRHPDLKELLLDGWEIESAVPHMPETEEVKLLVRLSR